MEENKIDAVMYIFVNRGLHMSAGKLGAQSAHAAVEAYRSSDPKLVKRWYDSGHTKLILQARNSETLQTIERSLNEHGLKTFPIIDEGRTEIDPNQFTALGVEIVDKSDEYVQNIFNTFQLYRE